MKKTTLFLLAGLVIFASCKKEDNPQTDDKAPSDHYALLLNEGSWGANNASISCIDLDNSTLTNDWFANANGRGLGDVAQDMIHYGSKLYVSVYMSNTIEVIDFATGRSVKQIDMGQRGPRYLACHEGKVYASCYDHSVVRIDTASLAIEAACPLSGMKPEQLCIVGSNIYVCNCWEYGEGSSFLYDNTLSVVDIATFKETGKISVGYNPDKIKALDSNRLLVACSGDYGGNPAQTLVVSLSDNSATQLDVAATDFDIYNGFIYLYTTEYDANYNPTAAFYRVDASTMQTSPLSITGLNYAYGITVNPNNGDLLICNSPYNANGDLLCYTPGGSRRWTAETGQYPSKVVF